MSLLQNSNAISSGGYDINNSLRFRSSASAYLSRTFSASGTTATFSVWIKRGTLGSYQTIFGWSNLSNTSFGIDLNLDTLAFYSYSSAFVLNLVTTQVLRDPSAWYHIVCVIDTTQATAANRAKIYINGSQVTALSTATYPSQNTSLNLATNTSWSIGRVASATTHYDGYMAEWNFIDGQALTPSSFGETDATTGVWKPKAYTGTYGTNGFYLKFSDIATTSGSNAGLGKDFSGNANYWTTNNISVTSGTTYDAMIDSPTLTSATVANYCVLNPLIYSPSTTYSKANLSFTSSNSNWTQAVGTFVIPSTGKWYWEVVIGSSYQSQMHGITATSSTLYSAGATNWVGWNPLGYAYWGDNGNKFNNNANSAYGNTYTANDIIGIAFDADNGKLFFSKNGTWQASGDPVAGTNAAFTGLTGNSFYPAFSLSTNTGATTADPNFGQRPFSYTPPTGYKALNTFNLPDSTIKKGNTVMDATLYTGTGTTNVIVNQGQFKPDLIWLKQRSVVGNHGLYDSIRGISNRLISNLTNAEASVPLDSFNTNGFTTTSNYNNLGETIVGWQWQAGQGSTSSNTSGSITSTVSVNATAGFSVVTYTGNGATGATVGHGLGVAPKMVIVKQRSSTEAWVVGHQNLTGWNYIVNLNSTAAQFIPSTQCLGTPTSTNIVVGPNAATNSNTATYVAYCWAEIAGFSKFGSYTGNGSADGPFVYTGFRPKYVLLKSTGVENWFVFDSSRNTYNVTTARLYPALSNAEDTNLNTLDLLSNGFKFRDTNVAWNGSGTTYIYMAFAENPFKNANAR